MQLEQLFQQLKGKKVVLIRCADDRVSAQERALGSLYCRLFSIASAVYEIVAEGAAWQFSQGNGLVEAGLQIHQHVLSVADVLIVCIHGDCAKYGGDDFTALEDNACATVFLRERTGKPVFLIWQPDPISLRYEIH